MAADLATPHGPDEFARASLNILGGVRRRGVRSRWQTRRPGGALALRDADYLADFESNLLAAVRLDRALAPALIEQRSGAIVNVGLAAARSPRRSAAARSPRRHPIGYVAAKAALSAYSKGLAGELGPYGIRVNVVQPGLVRTERMDERLAELAAGSGQSPEQHLTELVESYQVPLDRVATPDELAAAIVFLVSPAGSYLTGSQLTVDGGLIPTT